MDEKASRRRFLRDNRADLLRQETEEILAGMEQLLVERAKMDFILDYIRHDTLKRLARGCQTLAGLEKAITLLRQITPQNSEAVMILTGTAREIQADLEGVRESLSVLMRTLREASEGKQIS